jgi:ketosteroid isomerase-like protein
MGPWAYSPDRAADPVAFGHFSTVWRRDADGTWRAMIDHGIDHPRGDDGPLTWRQLGSAKRAPRGGEGAQAGDGLAALTAAEAAYNAALAKPGLAGALADWADSDVWINRNGHAPVQGVAAAAAAFGEEWRGGAERWSSHIGLVSQAGDLGYTYGSVELADPSLDPGGRSYMRVWRRAPGGAWRLALDVTTPIPPPPPPAPKAEGE